MQHRAGRIGVVLRAVGAGCTTGALAARLAVSAPTASVQATALREAGLLASARDGREVVHMVTALGAGLLLANPAPG
ncbi:ArsR/SmtB family transcription factor [Catenulispora rubra]|uniref:ArsR/SmtB family transcription factor n=1 Tax=Catenulispora rubra TaxID=280293 RepID=UPI0018921647|nr:winged helix-turn-helix domain-containing protein [Catenulispora rubra]